MNTIIQKTLAEKIKYSLIPPRLYIHYRVNKEYRRGEKELGLLPFLVDPTKNAIDAGANKGVWSYVLSHHAKHTYAFEPNPKIHMILKRNVRHLPITVSPKALSNINGTGELRVPRYATGHSNQGASLSITKISDSSTFTPISVETIPLDECGIENVGFIKIDVEGFEWSVVAGARNLIARDRPVMIIEIEEKHRNKSIEECLKEVTELGYSMLFVNKNGQIQNSEKFCAERNHRQPIDGYVFNFIFLPLN